MSIVIPFILAVGIFTWIISKTFYLAWMFFKTLTKLSEPVSPLINVIRWLPQDSVQRPWLLFTAYVVLYHHLQPQSGPGRSPHASCSQLLLGRFNMLVPLPGNTCPQTHCLPLHLQDEARGPFPESQV